MNPFVFVVLVSLGLYGSTAGAEIKFTPSELKEMQYQSLSLDQQKTIAKMWALESKDYRHYLWLMHHTPNGLYYSDKNLDPSWILGFNAKDDLERKKFAAIAIQNERARIEKELAFQKVFDVLQRELFPHDVAITYDALNEELNTFNHDIKNKKPH